MLESLLYPSGRVPISVLRGLNFLGEAFDWSSIHAFSFCPACVPCPAFSLLCNQMTMLQRGSENQMVAQKSPVLCLREIIGGDADMKYREGNVDGDQWEPGSLWMEEGR